MKADMQRELYSREQYDIHRPHHAKSPKKKLVGIVNCTPDSFYDGGQYNTKERAIAHANMLIEQGADLLDIGGQSTRPGATPISAAEELSRVMPVIKALTHPFSIDSFLPSVIEAAINEGACMINDVTGASSPDIRAIAKSSGLPLCVMHAQDSPHYPQGVVHNIKLWFQRRIDLLLREGIDPHQIIIDPGIGFGKSVQHNLEILAGLEEFTSLGFPLYVGLSRKSFMQKLLGISAAETLPTTLGLATLSLLKGAHFLRVHDVLEHRQIMTILESMCIL